MRRRGDLPYQLPGGPADFVGSLDARLPIGLLGTVAGVWLATQEVARAWGFHPDLGAPWQWPEASVQTAAGVLAGVMVLLGAVSLVRRDKLTATAMLLVAMAGGVWAYPAVYRPWEVVRWWWGFGYDAAAQRLMMWPSALGAAVALPSLVMALIGLSKTRAPSGDVHGAKEPLAGQRELAKAGFFAKTGIYLAKRDGRYLVSDTSAHVLVVAPTRTGKGVGPIQATLLDWRGATIVHDLKGENWQLCAGYRKHVLGHRCIRFAPADPQRDTARFNPVGELARSAHERLQSEATNLAYALLGVAHAKEETSSYFKGSAGRLLAAMLVRSVELYGEAATLHHAATFFAEGEEPAFESLASATHPYPRQQAGLLAARGQKERGSILGTLDEAMDVFSDEQVANATSASDFTPAELVDGETPVSLFLEIPETDRVRLGPLVRVIVQQIASSLTVGIQFSAEAPTKAHQHELLFLLDEFASLGRMDYFADALSYLAGYGMRAMMVLQNIGQLRTVYGREAAEAIAGNCGVTLAYAANDEMTAEWLSKLTGKMTVARADKRRKVGLGALVFDEGASQGQSLTGREVLQPGEIRALPDDLALLLAQGLKPVIAEKIRRYADPRFKNRVVEL